MYVYYIHAWYPNRSEGSLGSPGTGITDGDEAGTVWVLEIGPRVTSALNLCTASVAPEVLKMLKRTGLLKVELCFIL